ncbi:glycoside hydrolase family 16 protein [Aulographum hederae CBS 113979]|uniref:Glycoside hydrolase family 16 protein n=1 Tax=Aulographum hederae CBS 113979 TaxID=1176131 RepID=A0A6G1GK68_9PEZI|nr:glycoside hydrolase family 16 protein [Aulographum hederae CBS 113979]
MGLRRVFSLRVGMAVWALLASMANAACECGYSINATTTPTHQTYSDLLETDWLHTYNLTKSSIGWRPQEYNVTPSAARGPFGKAARVANVVVNPVADEEAWTGTTTLGGGDPGLQVWVRRGLEGERGDMVGMGEIAAERTDMLFGSYRVAMKMNGVPGTCGAIFWFRNDTQEIDMEFLSSQFNTTSSPVNLVLQSPASARAGFDAAGTPSFKLYQLPFTPSDGYHEYRFDWSPGRVSFYGDGHWLYDMTSSIPNSPGRLVMNHWSNGDPRWSAGPPAQDAVMTISYVKAYFNSTEQDRREVYQRNCPQPDLSKVCQIPDQLVPPEATRNETAKTFFFTKEEGMANGQVVYNVTHLGAASVLGAPGFVVWTAVLVVVVFVGVGVEVGL